MTPSIVANQGLASSELSLWALFWNAHWIVQGVMLTRGGAVVHPSFAPAKAA